MCVFLTKGAYKILRGHRVPHASITPGSYSFPVESEYLFIASYIKDFLAKAVLSPLSSMPFTLILRGFAFCIFYCLPLTVEASNNIDGRKGSLRKAIAFAHSKKWILSSTVRAKMQGKKIVKNVLKEVVKH